jgi:hypothetical protein
MINILFFSVFFVFDVNIDFTSRIVASTKILDSNLPLLLTTDELI